MSVTVQFIGLEKIQAITDPAAFERQLSIAVERSAERLRDDAKRMPPVSAKTTGYGVPGIPVDTGRMRQSIQKKKLGLLAAGVYADTKYSGFVHDGTGHKPAQPFFEELLTEFGGREAIVQIVAGTLQRLFAT